MLLSPIFVITSHFRSSRSAWNRRRFVDHDALGVLGKFEEGAQGGVLKGLQAIGQHRLAVVTAVRDVREVRLDLGAGNDVADVLRPAQRGEGEADHLVAHHRRTAAVPGVDGGVDLDAQPGRARARGVVTVRGEVDTGHDALGHGKAVATDRIAEGHHRVLDLGQCAHAGEGGAVFEEGLVFHLEDGQIHVAGQALHPRRHLVARLVRADLNLAREHHDVRVGEDTVARDHHPAPRGLGGRLLGPGFVGVRITHRGEDLDHRILEARGLGLGAGEGRAGCDQDGRQELPTHAYTLHCRPLAGHVVHVRPRSAAVFRGRQTPECRRVGPRAGSGPTL
jgi:hypothetical protein